MLWVQEAQTIEDGLPSSQKGPQENKEESNVGHIEWCENSSSEEEENEEVTNLSRMAHQD